MVKEIIQWIRNNCCPKFAKRKQRSKRRIPPQTPPPPLATSEFKKESVEVLRNPFPQKIVFAKPSPHQFRHLPEYLEGRTPKKNVLSIFRKNWSRANPKSKELFSFWGCRVKRGGGGTIRAYDLVLSHHALRACDIICFENRFGFGKINAPQTN